MATASLIVQRQRSLTSRSVGWRRVAGSNRVCDVPRETSQRPELGYVQNSRRLVECVCQTGCAVDLRDGVDLDVLGARLLNVPLLIDHSGRLPQGRAGRVIHLMPLYVSRETCYQLEPRTQSTNDPSVSRGTLRQHRQMPISRATQRHGSRPPPNYHAPNST